MPNRGGRWRLSLKTRLRRWMAKSTTSVALRAERFRYHCPEYLHAKSRETRRNRGLQGLALQALDNLCGDRAEYQRRDRLSFMRFVGPGLEDAVAGAKTL